MSGQAKFAFRVGDFPAGTFVVRSMSGRERLSELYEFDIVVHSSQHDVDIARTVGAPAMLTLDIQGQQRRFSGIVAAVVEEGARDSSGIDAAQYRFKLAPRALMLKHRRNSRIFQNRRVPQIIAQVMAEAGLVSHFRLAREYPKLDYCTQYEETDFEFISRLIGEHGMFFYAVQGEGEFEDFLSGTALDMAQFGLNAVTDAVSEANETAGQVAAAVSATALGQASAAESLVFSDEAVLYPNLGEELLADLRAALARGLDAVGEATGLSEVADASQLAGLARQGAPKLHYSPHAGALQRDAQQSLSAFSLHHKLVPRKGSYRIFDPERPNAPIAAEKLHIDTLDSGKAALTSVISGGDPGAALADVAAGAAQEGIAYASGRVRGFEMEVYEHQPFFLFPDSRYANKEPERILVNARRDHVTASGSSNCSRLETGRRFTLEDHNVGHVNGDYAVIAVIHTGSSVEAAGSGSRSAYSNAFECVPADVTYVAERQRRLTIQTCLTATVVGPAQEEVFAAELAQVKVQFHWDREGRRDENSSCWIRCMQGWAGSGWGMQFLPRVGSEVVVGFDGGDPDCPIILGSVYNGVNPAPFSLPEERTRSGLRTRTTPKGQAGNELSFEDASGHEQIKMVAERNLDTLVRNDRSAVVVKNDATTIEGDQRLEVKGQSRIDVHGAHNVELRSDVGLDVHGGVDMSLRGPERREIHGPSNTINRGDASHTVRGNFSQTVGTEETPRSYLLRVEGTTTLIGERDTTLLSEKSLTLQCGNSVIRLLPDRIELSSPEVIAVGEGATTRLTGGEIQMFAEGAAQLVSDTAVIKSSGAGIALGTEVKVDGSKILLNSPAQASDELKTETEPPTVIELKDETGEPMAYQRYTIVLGDGSEIAGMLGSDGTATLMLEENAQIKFPQLPDVDPA